MKYIYMIRAGKSQYKVGIATNIFNRIRQLQTANSQKIEIILMLQTVNAKRIEQFIHEQLLQNKTKGGTEWFNLSHEQVVKTCITINNLAIVPTLKSSQSFEEEVEKAIDLIKLHKKASASLLQRKMAIGYGKAARIMDELEDRGIVGQLYGIHRDVLII